MAPDVTIVIPCYKVGRYLTQTLKSALAQSHAAIQIVAVDDCSPDDTAEVIRRFQSLDPRVQGIFQPENAGVSVARNAGIDAAQAPWILFLDGDDWLPPNAVEQLLTLQNRTRADLPCANARQYDDAGTPGGIHFRRSRGRHEFGIDDGLDAFWPHQEVLCTCWAKLFPVRVLRTHGIRFNPALRHAQDTLFSLSFALQTRPRIAIDYDTEVYCYRQNPASCVHAIPVEKRLRNLETLVTALDDLALSTRQPRRLAAPKAAEYLWAIRKFSTTPAERDERTRELIQSPLFRDHLQPVLRQYGKFKHRLLLRLLAANHPGAIRWW